MNPSILFVFFEDTQGNTSKVIFAENNVFIVENIAGDAFQFRVHVLFFVDLLSTQASVAVESLSG